MNAFSLTQIPPIMSTSPTEDASRTNARDLMAYLHRAEQCAQQGCYEEALEVWKQIVRCCPDSAYAYLSLGGILTELHCWPEAIAAFQQAAHLQPNLKEAHYGAGMSYGQLGQFGPAIEAFQQANGVSADEAIKAYHLERHRLHTAAALPAEPSFAVVATDQEHGKSRRSRGKSASNESQQEHPTRPRFWNLWRR